MAQTKPKRLPDEAPIIGARILLIESRFHEEIADELVAGALARLEMARVKFDPIAVPGALEIPVAAAVSLEAAANAGLPYDGVVALGCVIRGKTSHYDIVAGESARALMEIGVGRKVRGRDEVRVWPHRRGPRQRLRTSRLPIG